MGNAMKVSKVNSGMVDPLWIAKTVISWTINYDYVGIWTVSLCIHVRFVSSVSQLVAEYWYLPIPNKTICSFKLPTSWPWIEKVIWFAFDKGSKRRLGKPKWKATNTWHQVRMNQLLLRNVSRVPIATAVKWSGGTSCYLGDEMNSYNS